MSATTVTHRQPATDDTTQLRRLVADSLVEAARANGTALVDWLADVDRLHNAINRLERLRADLAPQPERSASADDASLALLRVISVYDDAQERLEQRLADHPDLLETRAVLAAESADVMDPMLHGSLADRVCAVLEAEVRQVITL